MINQCRCGHNLIMNPHTQMGKGLAPILSDLEDAGAPIMESIMNLLKPLTDRKKKKKKPEPVVTYEDEENTLLKLLVNIFKE